MRGVLAVAVLGLLGTGCALHMDAELLNPWNRRVATAGEAVLVAHAHQLLEAGLDPKAVELRLVDQGVGADQARRIVALASEGPEVSK